MKPPPVEIPANEAIGCVIEVDVVMAQVSVPERDVDDNEDDSTVGIETRY